MLDIDFNEDWISENSKEVKPHIPLVIDAINADKNLDFDDEMNYVLLHFLANINIFHAQKITNFFNNNHSHFASKLFNYAFAAENDDAANSIFRSRYVFFKRAQVISRLLAPSRRKIVLNALDKHHQPDLLQVLESIAKAFGCTFIHNGKPVPYSKVFSNTLVSYNTGNFAPEETLSIIMGHAELVCQAAFGQLFAFTEASPYPHENMPYSILALCFADILLQLIEKTKPDNIDIGEIGSSNLNFLISSKKFASESPEHLTNLFKGKFVCPSKSDSLLQLFQLDLNALAQDITQIDTICGMSYKKAITKSNQVINRIRKATKYPPEIMLAKDQEKVEKYAKILIKSLSGMPSAWISELKKVGPNRDLDLDFDFDDLPDLPDYDNEEDLENNTENISTEPEINEDTDIENNSDDDLNYNEPDFEYELKLELDRELDLDEDNINEEKKEGTDSNLKDI